MDMKLFDTHCHLQLPQFDADRDAVLMRMQEKGVGTIVVGTDLASSHAAVELARQHDFLWASVGLHPTDNPAEQFDPEAFTELAGDNNVVAIGECGLDYFRGVEGGGELAGDKQRLIFQSQIELSITLKKPLMIHCRNAHNDLIPIFESYKREWGDKLQAIIHFLTGTAELAHRYLALDCHLSFPGPVTFTDMYDESILATQVDRILSETDSPFAAPAKYRGKRNEPAYVEEVVAKLALLKKVSQEEMAAQILTNAKRVFGI